MAALEETTIPRLKFQCHRSIFQSLIGLRPIILPQLDWMMKLFGKVLEIGREGGLLSEFFTLSLTQPDCTLYQR